MVSGEIIVKSELTDKLAEKTITKEELRKRVEQDFGLLPQLLDGVSSPKAAVRYGCGKVLMDLSAAHPEKLYPYMDAFTSLLDSKYRILVWNAMAVLANLCAVDVDKKFDAVFEKYYAFLSDEYLVTVANVVGNSGKIALSKPYLVPRITEKLLRVEDLSTTPHLTDECKRVIAEAAIDSFGMFFDKMGAEEKAKVLSFVKRQVNSSRKTLKSKAELFLKRWSG
jgi:hypothetical protein